MIQLHTQTADLFGLESIFAYSAYAQEVSIEFLKTIPVFEDVYGMKKTSTRYGPIKTFFKLQGKDLDDLKGSWPTIRLTDGGRDKSLVMGYIYQIGPKDKIVERSLKMIITGREERTISIVPGTPQMGTRKQEILLDIYKKYISGSV